MIVIPLILKIVELFIILIAAAAMMKLKLLRIEDSVGLSRVILYLILPCVIINAFQKELTPELAVQLAGSTIAAVMFHLIFILVSQFMKHVLHSSEVERASVIYTNCGNLIIPLVTASLGADWVIYVSMYILVFNILMWTHGISLFDHEGGFRLKKILTNTNVIGIIIGSFLLLTGIRLPGPLNAAISSVAQSVGPLSMMVTGMVIGGMSMQEIRKYRKAAKVVLLRMLVCPALAILFILLTNAAGRIPSGREIVMISLLSASAPSAGTISQIAIVYHHDERYASVISVLTTLACIVTMPFWIFVYELLV